MAPPRVREEGSLRVRPGKRLRAQLRAELAHFVNAKEGTLRHPLTLMWARRKRQAGLGITVDLQDLDDDHAEALDFIEAVYIGLSRKK